MPFNDVSYLELWLPFCSAERNHLCNFSREYHEEQFSEIILNLGQWFRSCCLKYLLSGALAALLFCGRTICAILVEGIMRNNSVKLF